MLLLRNAPPPEPSAHLPERILAAAQAAQRSPERALPKWRPAPAFAAAGLAVAVLVVLGLAVRSPAPPAGKPSSVSMTGEAPRSADNMTPRVAVAPSPTAPVVAQPATLAAREVAERASVRIERAVWRPRPTSLRQPRPEKRSNGPVLAYARAPLTPAVMVAEVSSVGGVVEPREAAPRVARVDTSGASAGGRLGTSGDFAHEVVGGLIANVMLSDYLEAAPEGTRVPLTASRGSNGT